MSIEIKTEAAQKFLHEAIERGDLAVFGRADFAKLSKQEGIPIITALRNNADLVFESRHRFPGALIMYGLGFEGKLSLGFVTLSDIRSPENNFEYSAVLAGETMMREHWQLYTPQAPLPESQYAKLAHPELQEVIVNSIRLGWDSMEKEADKLRVLRAWGTVLNTVERFPNFPQTTLLRMKSAVENLALQTSNKI